MGDDIATEAAGASVIMATCGDERHPPENIIEPKDGSFWVTTGLYPQEFVIKLGSTAQVNKVRTLTSNGTCVRVVCVVWERAVTGQGAREGERGGVCTRQRCDFTCVSVSRLHPLSPPRALLRPPKNQISPTFHFVEVNSSDQSTHARHASAHPLARYDYARPARINHHHLPYAMYPPPPPPPGKHK
jgi:hypothetical protein